MTEQLYVVVEEGRAVGRRTHSFQDCSTLRENPSAQVEAITEREAGLLGLKGCTVCERRKTGGPAIDALKDLLGGMPPGLLEQNEIEQGAWYLVNGLKDHGFYIAQRGARKASE